LVLYRPEPSGTVKLSRRETCEGQKPCLFFGGGKKGDLSRFIEDAVRTRILELTAEQAKAANANVSEADLTSAIEEALQWARNR
jgi:hypothetical protein